MAYFIMKIGTLLFGWYAAFFGLIDLFNNKDYNLVSNPIEAPILSIRIYIKYIK